VPVGNEHLIPENFSTFRNDRRWVFNRDRSSVEFANVSWWEVEFLTNDFERSSRLFICNDDVRRRFDDDSLGVNVNSDFLTILDRLLFKKRISVHDKLSIEEFYLTISSKSSRFGIQEVFNFFSTFAGTIELEKYKDKS